MTVLCSALRCRKASWVPDVETSYFRSDPAELYFACWVPVIASIFIPEELRLSRKGLIKGEHVAIILVQMTVCMQMTAWDVA